jgi:alpha-beta hydrolase superfamily lysophospholipase
MNNSTSSHATMPDAPTHWLNTEDGHRIPLRHWPVANPRAVIHIVHGMAEHSGCYSDVAPLLTAQGFAVIAHDHRCHGYATDETLLGQVSDTQHWNGVCADMVVVNRHIRSLYPDAPIAVLGHSMGSFIAQHFAQHHPESVNLLMLEGTSFEAPWFTALASRVVAGFECWRQGGNGRSRVIHALSFGGFNRPFRHPRTAFEWLSRDPAYVDRYIDDPRCGYQMVNAYWRDFLRGLSQLYRQESLKKMRRDLPLYIFAGDRDPVGHMGRGPTRLCKAYRDTAQLRDVTLTLYPEARHNLLHETNRSEVLGDMLGWLGRRLP